MDYIIRRTKLDDFDSVQDAHKRSIIELCSKDYGPEKIVKYADVNYSMDIWTNSVTNEYHLVIEVDGKVEGMCHAKVGDNQTGYILGLYFTNVIAGKGIGREVFEIVMNYFSEYDLKKIYLTGTITAKGFYEKMGFKVIEKSQATIREAVIDCYKMELDLSRPKSS